MKHCKQSVDFGGITRLGPLRIPRGFPDPVVMLMLVTAGVSLGFGPSSMAITKVREGIRHYKLGAYDAAGKSFAEADVAAPENHVIAFDRACVLAAADDVEKARDLFRQASLSRDSALTAKAHYNLGSLAAKQGRATLSPDPLAANTEQRQQGVAQLLTAVGHYRDCLKIDSNHTDARYNLELIRQFIKWIQSQWEQRDREKTRQETGVLEFLAMIEQRQAALRSVTRVLSVEQDSPQRRQAVRDTQESQKRLEEEIPVLQEKLRQQLQAPQQQTSAADKTAMEQAHELLTGFTNEAGARMLKAAAEIDAGRLLDAENPQGDVLNALNQVFMALSPFTGLLQRSLAEQESLVQASESWIGSEETEPVGESDDAVFSKNQQARDATRQDHAPPPNPEPADTTVSSLDFVDVAWRQSRVTDWSQILILKARAELDQLNSQAASPPIGELTPVTPDTQPLDPAVRNSSAEATSAADPAAQREAMKTAYQKTLELGPIVVQHSESATNHLRNKNSPLSLPDQQECLRLLKDIAESLPRQEQSPPDPQKPNPDGKDPGDKSQNTPGDPPPRQDNQQQENPSSAEKPQDGQSAKERAISVLRRARERERKHRELQKQLDQMVGGRVQVDRDW